MGQDPQLDLAVVRIHQDPTRLGDEHPPQLAPQLRADGDILQIWVRRRQASCGGDGILERRMNAPIRGDDLQQAIGIRRFQLRQHPIAEDLRDNRVLALQLFQHFRVGRVAGLRLFPMGQLQLLK